MYKFLIIICLLGLGAQAQDHSELVPIKDLKSQWLTVDRTGSHYLPYIQGRTLSYPVLGFIIDETDGPGMTLAACVPENTSVFLNNMIVYRTKASKCLYYNLDSLRQKYPDKSLFFSLFRKNLDPGTVSTTLMVNRTVSQLQAQTGPTIQVTRRSNDQFTDFFIVAVMIVAAFYAFLINRYPKGNRDFFNFSKAFSLTLKEEKVLTQRNMSTANTLFFMMYGMSIALIIVLFWKLFDGIPEIFEFFSLDNFKSSFLSWLSLSFAAFLVVELKYLLIKLLASLLNIDKIAQIHFFDFVRIGLIFISTILIVSTVLYLGKVDQFMIYRGLLYAFVFLLGIRIIILLFKLIGDTSYRKIHLISYLCTTEILPLLIGIRIFF